MTRQLGGHKYKLSICIATHNRVDFLRQLLADVITQIQALDDVAIVIADGCSTDGTGDMCKEFEMRCPRIHHVMLEEKGGVDKDFDLAVRHANSEYCWLFCDDDLIEHGAIRKIYELLHEHEPELMIINASSWNFDCSEVLSERAMNIFEDIVVGPDDDVLDRVFKICGTYLSFSGGILFKRDKWLNVDTEKYYETRFGDTCTISQFGNDIKAYVLAKPYVRVRLGNAEWSAISFKVWYELWRNTIWSLTNLSDNVKKHVAPTDKISTFKLVMWHRATESYGVQEYERYFKRSNYIERLIGFLGVIAPPVLLRTIFSFIAYIRQDRLALHNLGGGRFTKNRWLSDD